MTNLNSGININDIETFVFIDNCKTLNDCTIFNVGNQNEIVNLNNLENDLQHFFQTIEGYNIVDSGNEVDDGNLSIIHTILETPKSK